MKNKENGEQIVILERNGIFLVGCMETKYKFLWFFPYKDFRCYYKELNLPAHFSTLKRAEDYVKKISKPDVYHKVKNKIKI